MSDDLLPAPAFDPGSISLDLSNDHKIRVTALMLATKYYDGTIVKDGEMYKQMVQVERKNLRPAHYTGVVSAAIAFEHYIKTGQLRVTKEDGQEIIEIGRPTPDQPQPDGDQ